MEEVAGGGVECFVPPGNGARVVAFGLEGLFEDVELPAVPLEEDALLGVRQYFFFGEREVVLSSRRTCRVVDYIPICVICSLLMSGLEITESI